MTKAGSVGIAACVLVAGWSSESTGQGPEPPRTAKILSAIEDNRERVTLDDRKAAWNLVYMGDRAYRRGDYSAAFTAYTNAYPNAPSAYAYIMAGDANWRAIERYHLAEAQKPDRAPQTCGLDNSNFVHDLSQVLDQNYAVGLALAARHDEGDTLPPTLQQRARDSAICLAVLAHDYEGASRSACVDLAKLGHCLGAPLIK